MQVTNPGPTSPKARLRAEVRAALDGVASETLAAASAEIVTHLATWLTARAGNGIIATFAALPHEPELAALSLRLPARRFAWPRAGRDGAMDFHEVADPGTGLRAGRFGLLEPDPDLCPLVDPGEIATVLCPGEAFTRRGDRLGKGGGFYDRFLPRCRPDVSRIGIAFALQILPEIPTDAHDHRVGWLATEDGLFSCEG